MEPCYPVSLNKFRVLFSDGFVFDCIAIRDDSDFRGWVLEYNGYKTKSDVKIVGIAKLEVFGAIESKEF
jgi:hypothetical protein